MSLSNVNAAMREFQLKNVLWNWRFKFTLFTYFFSMSKKNRKVILSTLKKTFRRILFHLPTNRILRSKA